MSNFSQKLLQKKIICDIIQRSKDTTNIQFNKKQYALLAQLDNNLTIVANLSICNYKHCPLTTF